jgi:hypothetical protein
VNADGLSVSSLKSAIVSSTLASIGYNASTNTFILYNPWGTDQPGQLTWAQLQASCTQMAVCDTSGSAPRAGATAPTVSAKATLFGQVPDIAASVLAAADDLLLPDEALAVLV